MFPTSWYPPGVFPPGYFPKTGSGGGSPPTPPGPPPGLTRTVQIRGDPSTAFSLAGDPVSDTRQLRGSPSPGVTTTGNITGGD